MCCTYVDLLCIYLLTHQFMDVSQSRYAERETLFQCCVELTGGPQVCGEHYIFDPLGEACMLLGKLVTTEAHCYSV